MSIWEPRKSRDEKRLDLPKPIPVLLRDWIHTDIYVPVNLIALTWKKKNNPDAIVKHLDGKEKKVEYFNTEHLFLDNGDGIQTAHDIVGLEKEREKQYQKFTELIDALYTRIPKPDLQKIIEENGK